mmetsp:Transcript_7740/g.11535  ORF Transcript_7740/g.11535 Transcript_7740/m.11535 type:complete len:144 (+) Transcript_7740:339-770(+)
MYIVEPTVQQKKVRLDLSGRKTSPHVLFRHPLFTTNPSKEETDANINVWTLTQSLNQPLCKVYHSHQCLHSAIHLFTSAKYTPQRARAHTHPNPKKSDILTIASGIGHYPTFPPSASSQQDAKIAQDHASTTPQPHDSTDLSD